MTEVRRPVRNDKNKRPQKEGGRKQGNHNRVVGLGDHVPAFMLRDIRTTAAPKAEEPVVEEAKSDDENAA